MALVSRYRQIEQPSPGCSRRRQASRAAKGAAESGGGRRVSGRHTCRRARSRLRPQPGPEALQERLRQHATSCLQSQRAKAKARRRCCQHVKSGQGDWRDAVAAPGPTAAIPVPRGTLGGGEAGGSCSPSGSGVHHPARGQLGAEAARGVVGWCRAAVKKIRTQGGRVLPLCRGHQGGQQRGRTVW